MYYTRWSGGSFMTRFASCSRRGKPPRSTSNSWKVLKPALIFLSDRITVKQVKNFASGRPLKFFRALSGELHTYIRSAELLAVLLMWRNLVHKGSAALLSEARDTSTSCQRTTNVKIGKNHMPHRVRSFPIRALLAAIVHQRGASATTKSSCFLQDSKQICKISWALWDTTCTCIR